MNLYDYYRSSSCYRVRIALNIKKVSYNLIPVHLVNNGGEQNLAAYQNINPQKLVPSLETENHYINQSLAIIEYLEEKYPNNPLLPKDLFARAEIRSIALLIACEIHPLNNLKVLQTLKHKFNFNEEQKTIWYHTWLKEGFDALELKLTKLPRTKEVCYGDNISLADICLIPQVYNATRFNFSLETYPLISSINNYCLTLTDFSQAAPLI
jgi:maleylacetoacetate isomerase